MAMFGRRPHEIGHVFATYPKFHEKDEWCVDEEEEDIPERDAVVERRSTSPRGRAKAIEEIYALDAEVMRLIGIAIAATDDKDASIKQALQGCDKALARVEQSSSVLWPREARFRRHMAQLLDMQDYRGRAKKQRRIAKDIEKRTKQRGILLIHSWKVPAR